MISDKLYKLAFEYKRTKLWQSLLDTMLFAVKLSDGRIGYICVEGFMGKDCALDLYIGDEGIDSYRILTGADWMLAPDEYQESFFQRQCLQCIFNGKEEVAPEDREEVKKYARENGIKIAGKNAYPQFVKYQPGCFPWKVGAQDQELLGEALSAAIWMAGLLEKNQAKMLGFKGSDGMLEVIPMLERKGDAYILGKTVLPAEKVRTWPEPAAHNDIGIANLKKAKRAGVWECEIIRCPEPVQDKEQEVPVFPIILLAVESIGGYLLPVSPVAHYESDPEELLNLFIDALILYNACPKKIKVRDERTYAFAKAFCDRLRIPLCKEDKLLALDEAEEDFFQRFDMSEEEQLEEAADFIDKLFEIDRSELDALPAGLLEQLKLLAEQGILPDTSEAKLVHLLNPIKEGKPVKKKKPKVTQIKVAAKQSYVFSVSLGTGCYRHIQISGNNTLYDLHESIIDAFEFIDDHAHAFFMDNRSWSDWDSYYSRGIDTGRRLTDKAKLCKVGLYKGKTFKYIFDFGDEWTFQCKVLRIVDGDTGAAEVIKSKGEAPPQYGDWYDWDEDGDE